MFSSQTIYLVYLASDKEISRMFLPVSSGLLLVGTLELLITKSGQFINNLDLEIVKCNIFTTTKQAKTVLM